MNQTHIHLVITHLPIFGSILGGFVLAHGLWLHNRITKIAAYNVLILSSIGGVIAYLTGEAAEETAEHLAGVSESAIHNHEEFAELTIVAIGITGALALVGLLRTIRTHGEHQKLGYLIMLAAVACFGMTSYTGYLGGQIRHTELHGKVTMEVEEDEHAEQEHLDDKESEQKGRKRRRGRDH